MSHFQKHGHEFGLNTYQDYENQADRFFAKPIGGNVMQKQRGNGDWVGYDSSANEFGILSPHGFIRTYFKPDPNVHKLATNLAYFNSQ
jgi:pyocin large subunit-like protein